MKQVLIENAEAQALAVLSLCLRITGQGRYHAFFDWSAHVTTIGVSIQSAAHKYEPKAIDPEEKRFDARLGTNDRHRPLYGYEDLSQYQAEVDDLLTQLQTYLAPEKNA